MGLVHGCALPYRKTEAALEGLEVAQFAAKCAIEKAPPVATPFRCPVRIERSIATNSFSNRSRLSETRQLLSSSVALKAGGTGPSCRKERPRGVDRLGREAHLRIHRMLARPRAARPAMEVGAAIGRSRRNQSLKRANAGPEALSRRGGNDASRVVEFDGKQRADVPPASTRLSQGQGRSGTRSRRRQRQATTSARL